MLQSVVSIAKIMRVNLSYYVRHWQFSAQFSTGFVVVDSRSGIVVLGFVKFFGFGLRRCFLS